MAISQLQQNSSPISTRKSKYTQYEVLVKATTLSLEELPSSNQKLFSYEFNKMLTDDHRMGKAAATMV
jgi:hypothetical protein